MAWSPYRCNDDTTDPSQEIHAMDVFTAEVYSFKIIFGASPQAYSSMVMTRWRPGFI